MSPVPTVSGHRVGETFRDCADDCPEMVVIPPGRFQMGSPHSEQGRDNDEGPVHEVTIGYALAVGKYPITRREWKQFVKETGHNDNSDCLRGHQDDHPVVNVSWRDAQDYAAWLSRKSGQQYRLLTEAEYEYANRAGSQTAYFWGDSADELPRYANNKNDRGGSAPFAISLSSGHGPTVVGSFKPNAFGLYDTTGNVWSWTQDCYHDNYNGAPTDGSAWGAAGNCCAGRVARGGSYGGSPRWLRAAARVRPNDDDNDVGFRLART